MAAGKEKITLTQISKDFNLKPKEVIDVFKSFGVEKKSGATVEKDDFELFLQNITINNQIKDLEAYCSGAVTINSVREKKPEPEVKAEPKAEPKAEAKAEPKAAMPKEPTAEKKPEPKPAPAVQEKRTAPTAQRQGDRPERRPNPQDRPMRVQREGYQQREPYSKYNAKPQDNPFAKRIEGMNRRAEGKPMQRPMAAQPTAKPQQPPKAAETTVRPAQQVALERQRLAEERAKAAAAAQQGTAQPQQKREREKIQKQQFRKITPVVDVKNVQGGVNIGVDYTDDRQA